LSEEYGYGEGNFNREREEREIIEELAGVLVQAWPLGRSLTARSERPVAPAKI
jgi:hypothetical protein